MDASIIRSLLKCKLSYSDLRPIQFEEEDLAKGIIERELSVYAKVLSFKESFVSIQGMKLALSKGWNCQDIRISRVTGPILNIFFPSSFEKKRIMETRPWGLKLEFFTWEVANKLGEAFPRCEDVELRREKGGSEFFRIKRGVNVLQPLRRLVQFQVEEKIKVPVKKSWIIFNINKEPQDCLPPIILEGDNKSQLLYNFSGVNGEQSSPSVSPGFSKRINEEARNVELNQKEELSDVNASMDGERELQVSIMTPIQQALTPISKSNKDIILGDNFKARLDRALASKDWEDCYPDAHVHHLSTNTSDYLPLHLILGIKSQIFSEVTRRFCFEQDWCLYDESKLVVQEAWDKVEEDDPGARVMDGICSSRLGLQNWKRHRLGHVQNSINSKQQ
ncbi:hypothetical protein LIER_11677 [Lithospermum erythrorhizon]|uniref:DUF4283 domain-containing protein n=1 Tax=Lithospermum erythrorhizon TaxID=34254 RepID=A0AAV3PR78_LITER